MAIAMNELQRMMQEMANDALEANTKIAGLAVVTKQGKVVYQSANWDVSKQSQALMGVLAGQKTFQWNNVSFSVLESNSDGIIAVNPSGMGSVILARFSAGLLVAYAMPKAEPRQVLRFLKGYAAKLEGKV
jgi:hypothetical protein